MKNRGFTLVELLTVMAIVAIVAALAGPGLRDLIEGSRLTTTTNNIVEGIATTRSEAVKRRESMTLKPTDGADWKNGWSVYDSADAAIKQFDGFTSDLTVTASSDLDSITFLPNGNRQGGASVTLSVCADSGKGREITLTALGSTSVVKVDSGCGT